MQWSMDARLSFIPLNLGEIFVQMSLSDYSSLS
jgi:hypothetical protein